MRAAKHQKQTGIALIVVLWALALLTTVAAAVTFTQRTEINLNRSLLQQVQARQLAAAGLNYALYMLLLNDRERAWQTDGEPRGLRFGDQLLQISVFKEQGLVDINRADAQLLAKALAAAGLDETAAAAMLDVIEDWKDGDDVRRLHGAENQKYHAAGYGYQPVNGPFRDLAELRLVFGMSPQLYLRLRQLLTVDSGRANVDLMGSPPAVRSWLGDDLAGGGDSTRPTTQRRPSLRSGGGFVGGITAASRDGLRVRVAVPLARGGRYVAEATVVLDNRSTRGYRIVKWHEAGAGLLQHSNDSGSAG